MKNQFASPEVLLGKQLKKRPVALIFLTLYICIGFLFYSYSLWNRTKHFYDHIKGGTPGWRGKVHQADEVLGFAPTPDSRGAQVFPIGRDLPMRYDRNGFRVPVDREAGSSKRRPLVLSLGCSLTYGDGVPAENAYPFLVGQYLGGTTINAGVCSYGLSQMFFLARRLIPLYRPDFVTVQYSPWLVERAQSPFAPTFFGRLPTPYFFERNGVQLHPPVFRTKIFDLDADQYRQTKRGRADLFSFFWHVALPLFLYDDFHKAGYYGKRLFGIIPKPSGNRQLVEQYVYRQMGSVARENGSEIVIVILGGDEKLITIPQSVILAGAIVVDAQAALLQRLQPATSENYKKQYFQWRGNPPTMINDHPNESAHKLIAEEIVSKIQARGKN